MTPKLQQALKQATAEQLKSLVETIYGITDDIDNRIENCLLSGDPQALTSQLKNRISSIARGRRYIDYHHAAEFSRDMDLLIDDIDKLIDIAPKHAFALVDRLMGTHRNVYGRADDSDGVIGDSYSLALSVWLKAAHHWRQTGNCPLDWKAELISRHNDDDYGIWSGLIAQGGDLITYEEGMQLAAHFEAEFNAAHDVASTRDFDPKAALAAYGIASVAKALGDVTLYEHAVLIESPKPNELQKQGIIEFCLSVKDGESALKWLAGSWDNYYEPKRLSLLDKTYLMLGRHQELLDLRRDAYQLHPDHLRLKALLEILPEQERPALQDNAIENALKINEIESKIETLLAIGGITQAQEQIFAHMSELKVFFGTLLNWAQLFHQAHHNLAESVCYRLLLEEILVSARNKAYDHAARYFRKLAKLDALIDNYYPLTPWAEYQAQLKLQHGRKSSFWQRVAE